MTSIPLGGFWRSWQQRRALAATLISICVLNIFKSYSQGDVKTFYIAKRKSHSGKFQALALGRAQQCHAVPSSPSSPSSRCPCKDCEEQRRARVGFGFASSTYRARFRTLLYTLYTLYYINVWFFIFYACFSFNVYYIYIYV